MAAWRNQHSGWLQLAVDVATTSQLETSRDVVCVLRGLVRTWSKPGPNLAPKELGAYYYATYRQALP